MLFFYTLLIRLYGLAIFCAQPFRSKAKKWWWGRKTQNIKGVRSGEKPIWIHCASLGEFEQGRSLIEMLKQKNPNMPIVVTFFSPSGFEIRSNYEQADAVYYLPLDLPKKVDRFLIEIQPRMAIFVKYEFWFNYLKALKKRKIPYLFISVVMRSRHPFLSSFFKTFRSLIAASDHIFCQDAATVSLLKKKGMNRVSQAGDTRIDRVIKIANEPRSYPNLEALVSGKKVIVFGSIWPPDLDLIAPIIEKNSANYIYIIAAHDISEAFLQKIEDRFSHSVARLTRLSQHTATKIVSVDTIGDLAFIYRLAWLAYVGGGFGKGIHSILEPAAYQIPVLFGPNHKKFTEAGQLIKGGGARCLHNSVDLERAIKHFEIDDHYQRSRNAVQDFLFTNKGATSKIVNYLHEQKFTQ